MTCKLLKLSPDELGRLLCVLVDPIIVFRFIKWKSSILSEKYIFTPANSCHLSLDHVLHFSHYIESYDLQTAQIESWWIGPATLCPGWSHRIFWIYIMKIVYSFRKSHIYSCQFMLFESRLFFRIVVSNPLFDLKICMKLLK